MKKILVTGGTVFVSRFAAAYFMERGYEVYVLNRNTREQLEGVHLICRDRHQLGDVLKNYHFDAVLDICGYDRKDVEDLLNGLGEFEDYIFISSAAVYPETGPQPFREDQPVEVNSCAGKYSSDKLEAEQYLMSRYPQAYIFRPPYLYGPMQNIYREPFLFECALKGRKFYIPGDGKLKLQFCHVEDLCRLMERILEQHPRDHIYNTGSRETVDINTFVRLCYQAAGAPLETIHTDHKPWRDYFCFTDYEYRLDVSRQDKLLSEIKDLAEGFRESFEWYRKHQEEVSRRDYISFIDNHLRV